MTVERLHAAIYAGRVVDRAGAELQNEGSMIMGLGTALFESIEHSDGQISNANLSDYSLPALGDLPREMTHELIEREGAEVHGLGETACAVAGRDRNALGSLGIQLTDLPSRQECWGEDRPRPERPPRRSNAIPARW